MERIFSPEFRNRIDAVVTFRSLDHDVVLQVVGKSIRELQAELAAKNVTLEVTDACREWLARKGLFAGSSGRGRIARLVSAQLKDFFVEEILFGRLTNGGRARADIENDAVVLSVLS